MLRTWQKEKDGTKIDSLLHENGLLIKAILDIKRHQETVVSQSFLGKPMYESSVVWNISNNVLKHIGYLDEKDTF